jgi:translation initiation factor 3 subunit H
VEDGATYQLEMMRSLREVNVDNNTVGWYQSTYMGAYQSVELIDTFLQYQVSRRSLERVFSTLAGGYLAK